MSTPTWSHRGYRLLLRCLSPWLLVWLWWRGRNDAGYRANMAQRLGRIEPLAASSHGILIHAASVGEVQAAQPLIEALRGHWPDHAITVTTQTPTGKRALHNHFGDAIQHLFFPVDTPAATARFLERLQPRLVVLIEREVWPEWLLQCRSRAIPVALVNARMSAKSAVGYRRLRGLMRPAWQGLGLVVAGDQDSGKRLQELGVPMANLLLAGNLKFDLKATSASPTVPFMPGLPRPMIVAGSTHEGEESAWLGAWPDFLRQHPDALLVIVPRHPERFDGVADQIRASGLAFARRSRGEVPDADTSIWLGDTMGELGAWYAQASLCFIGGTLVPVGGHNPLEALAAGKPVLYGPHTHNASALYGAIGQSTAGQQVPSAAAALSVAAQWLIAPNALREKSHIARAFVNAQQGGSARTVQALQALWRPLQPRQLSAVAEHRVASTTIWHNAPMLGAAVAQDLFDPAANSTQALATGSGRGQAQRLTLDGHDVVLRHYRRGGLVGRFNPDRYRIGPACESRAMREYALLRWMSACGLPVPVPVAARQVVKGRSYTADIVVGMIPGTLNLVQHLVSAPLSERQWRAVGHAIRQLHDTQVFHSDLNAHNILLDTQNRAWIVDFDKCELRPDGPWKSDNLGRLERSLRKEAARLAHFHWTSADTELLHAGYTATAIQPDDGRSMIGL